MEVSMSIIVFAWFSSDNLRHLAVPQRAFCRVARHLRFDSDLGWYTDAQGARLLLQLAGTSIVG
jgi:hypothetical protein